MPSLTDGQHLIAYLIDLRQHQLTRARRVRSSLAQAAVGDACQHSTSHACQTLRARSPHPISLSSAWQPTSKQSGGETRRGSAWCKITQVNQSAKASCHIRPYLHSLPMRFREASAQHPSPSRTPRPGTGCGRSSFWSLPATMSLIASF